MKKYLIGFIIAMISIIPISSASALELSDGTTFPDIPSGFDNYVIVTRGDGSKRLFTWNSSNNIYVVQTGASLNFSTSLNDYSRYLSHNYVSIYNYTNGSWVYYKKTNGAAWGYSSINASIVNIYDSTTFDVVYEAGYGLAPDKTINITSNDASDLDGTEIKVVNIDFSEVYDSSYTYQFKTDFGNWVDITDQVNEAASYDYYYYLFI